MRVMDHSLLLIENIFKFVQQLPLPIFLAGDPAVLEHFAICEILTERENVDYVVFDNARLGHFTGLVVCV